MLGGRHAIRQPLGDKPGEGAPEAMTCVSQRPAGAGRCCQCQGMAEAAPTSVRTGEWAWAMLAALRRALFVHGAMLLAVKGQG